VLRFEKEELLFDVWQLTCGMSAATQSSHGYGGVNAICSPKGGQCYVSKRSTTTQGVTSNDEAVGEIAWFSARINDNVYAQSQAEADLHG